MLHRRAVRRQYAVADVLERVGRLLHDLMWILGGSGPAREESAVLDEGLRQAVVDVLDRLADLVERYDTDLSAEHPTVRQAQAAMTRLTGESTSRRELPPEVFAIVGAVVANLWSATDVLCSPGDQ